MSGRRAITTAALVALLCMSVPASAAAPRDFTPEVLALWQVAACGGDNGAPVEYDAKIVAAHCKDIEKSIASWKKKWLEKAAPFFADLLKAGYPATVVYPFGGGDLLTVLAVYPDATEYTLMSLEGMGDPRPVLALALASGADKKATKAAHKQLTTRLKKLRTVLTAQLGWAWNTTIQLSNDSNDLGTGALPAVLIMTLVALESHGYEPLSAKFFKLAADGSIVYLSADDITAADAELKKTIDANQKKKHNENIVQVGAFNNVELTFRKRGDAKAPIKTFRHVAADLSDGGLDKDGAALAHVGKKGKVAAMTKAASYLLWMKSFSKIRDYLLANMQVMVADDTGIPPRYAAPAGFEQATWGQFHGAYFGNGGGKDVQAELVKLWKKSSGKLPFRFGYYDNDGHAHLLFTWKK